QLQRLHGNRLVIDEGACAPVGMLDAAQDQGAIVSNIETASRLPGGMLRRHLEDGRHLPLRLTVAHKTAVAAPTQGEREGVEQDGLAGAGFTGEDAEPPIEGKIEPIDQDDVADGELDEHAARAAISRRAPRSARSRGTPG